MTPPTTDEIMKKYQAQIESKLKSNTSKSGSQYYSGYSKEYSQFKQEMLPEISRYKRWAQTLGNLIRIKLSPKDQIKFQRYLDTAHVDVTPSQALTLSVISFLLVFFLVLLTATAWFLINQTIQLLFIFLGLLASLFVFYYTYSMPKRLANSWRLKASSQMVPAILYLVAYMKHTANLERAVEFTSEHLDAPLGLDFKKIFYDVEVGRYSSIKQSLDNYLESWRNYAPEFIESFHLIESSLYEPSESRRIIILEKSLQVILDGVYEKMLKYSREIRSPLTNIYMLGIILPTLGLALLPLASTLLQGAIQWQHIFILFNVIIPFLVFYMTSEALLKRPGGHGEASVLELNPEYHKFTSKSAWVKAFLIAFPLLILGLLPFIFQIPGLDSIGIQSDYTFGQIGSPFLEEEKLFDFKTTDSGKVGPFGILGVLLSLFVPLSVALFFSVAYKQKTKSLINARNETKELETEFTNSMFQLGNRLSDGTPAELAFSKVAESTQSQKTHSFFTLVSQNIRNFGMTLEEAIFNKNRGAIIYYPSALISTSMKILVESVKKGLQIAARSLMSISEYVKNIQRISERLRDLLAEIVSDMKSNMVFLAPLLSGIVVGLATMITLILNKLQILTLEGQGATEIAGFGSVGTITTLFNVELMIPPYFVQTAIGIYIIEIIFILTTALVTIDSGKDTLQEKYQISRNLVKGITLYLITTLISVIALAALASISLAGLG